MTDLVRIDAAHAATIRAGAAAAAALGMPTCAAAVLSNHPLWGCAVIVHVAANNDLWRPGFCRPDYEVDGAVTAAERLTEARNLASIERKSA